MTGLAMTTYAVTEPEKRFFLHQGEALESLEDLFTELQTIEEHQFSHHVNDERHDFATWVEHCFEDKFLAKRMRSAKSIEELQKEIFISLFR